MKLAVRYGKGEKRKFGVGRWNFVFFHRHVSVGFIDSKGNTQLRGAHNYVETFKQSSGVAQWSG